MAAAAVSARRPYSWQKRLAQPCLLRPENEEKCKVCRELGADLVINYNDEDFVEACGNATAGNGVDVILDMVAGDYTNRNIAAAAVEGRYVIIAGLRGFSAEVSIRSIMLKRLVVTGSTLRPRPVAFKAAIAAGLREQVWPPAGVRSG